MQLSVVEKEEGFYDFVHLAAKTVVGSLRKEN
jgi:hypothetical protein